jgi:hypothetical protein
MVKHTRSLWAYFFALAILFSSCSFSPAVPTATKLNPNAVLTSAAQTASARGTELAQSSPSPAPATPTSTVTPTIAAATPAITVTLPVTGTTTLPTQQATITATFAPAPTTGDKAEFVQDVTIPDGTEVKPGEKFTKTWRLKNAGTTTWTTAYSLVHVGNDKIGGPASVPLAKNAAPGEMIDLSVELTAPDSSGTHTGFWKLSNDKSQLFGIGPSGAEAFYVQIKVPGGAASTPGSGTPEATSTPGSGGGGQVSGLAVSIDNADFSGTCPHEYTVTASFDLKNPATVTYQLEAGADKAGFNFNLPGPQTSAFPAGTQTLVFNLNINDSVNGWVRLLITAPEEKRSKKAEFALTCK